MSPARMDRVETGMRAVLAFNEAFNRHDVAGMMRLMTARSTNFMDYMSTYGQGWRAFFMLSIMVTFAWIWWPRRRMPRPVAWLGGAVALAAFSASTVGIVRTVARKIHHVKLPLDASLLVATHDFLQPVEGDVGFFRRERTPPPPAVFSHTAAKDVLLLIVESFR